MINAASWMKVLAIVLMLGAVGAMADNDVITSDETLDDAENAGSNDEDGDAEGGEQLLGLAAFDTVDTTLGTLGTIGTVGTTTTQ